MHHEVVTFPMRKASEKRNDFLEVSLPGADGQGHCILASLLILDAHIVLISSKKSDVAQQAFLLKLMCFVMLGLICLSYVQFTWLKKSLVMSCPLSLGTIVKPSRTKYQSESQHASGRPALRTSTGRLWSNDVSWPQWSLAAVQWRRF